MRTAIETRILVISWLLIFGFLVAVAFSGGVVRSLGGDFLVVQWLYLSVRILFRRISSYMAAIGVVVFAFIVEFVQLIFASYIPDTLFFRLTVGSTFHTLDLLMYGLGTLFIVTIEHVLIRSHSNSSNRH